MKAYSAISSGSSLMYIEAGGPHFGSWLPYGFSTVILIPIQASSLFCFVFLLIRMRGKQTSALKDFLKKTTKPNSDFHWRLLGKSSYRCCSTAYFYLRALSLQVAAGGRHCNTGFMVSWWNPTESHKPLPVSKFPVQQSPLQAFGEIIWTLFIYQAY